MAVCVGLEQRRHLFEARLGFEHGGCFSFQFRRVLLEKFLAWIDQKTRLVIAQSLHSRAI
jgi:hypothetical protein